MKNDQESGGQGRGNEQGPSGEGMHELLCAYVLGEVTEAERAHVEAALAASEELRGELANLEATIGLVQGALGEPEQLSEAATSELLKRATVGTSGVGSAGIVADGDSMEAKMAMSYSRHVWTRPLIQMAAAAMILVFASLAFFVKNDASMETARMESKSESAELESQVGKRAKGDAATLDLTPEVRAEYVNELNNGRLNVKEVTRGSRNQPTEKIVNLSAEWDEAQEVLVGGSYKDGGLAARAEARKPSAAIGDGQEVADAGESKRRNPVTNRYDTSSSGEPEAALLEALGYLGHDELEEIETESHAGLGYLDDSLSPGKDELFTSVATTGFVENILKASDNYMGNPNSVQSKTVDAPRQGEEGTQAAVASDKPDLDRNYTVDSNLSVAERKTYLRDEAEKRGDTQLLEILDFLESDTGQQRPRPAYVLPEELSDLADPVGKAKSESWEEDALRSKRGEIPSPEDWVVLPTIEEILAQGQRKSGTQGASADELIAACRRRPHETPSAMFFRYWGDNAFEYPLADPLSTFSVDVDTASYAVVRKYLQAGTLPPKAVVRTEEFVNYFKADVEAPFEGDFGITTELAPSLFGGNNQERWMMRVVVRGREVLKQEREPLSLTFVVDTSGSMNTGNRIELVKHALRLLVAELDANDSISVVSFSNEADLVLPMTSAANRSDIEMAINSLQSEGGTNPESGLQLGYAQASAALREGAGNRVIFLSDGVGNMGQTNQDALTEAVREQRESGIYLNTIGVGLGNHNDTFLEQLANKGDGICNYIDDAEEAHRAIVQNFTGAFQTIARDVKIQVEFDPAQVMSYRLLGYENRAIADKDFRNDAVDAGEVGAGHQVTALYELVRNATAPDPELPLATVRLRWKKPHTPTHRVGVDEAAEVVTEIAHVVRARSAAGGYRATSAGYRRAVLVAQFAEFLRVSRHASQDSIETLVAEAKLLEAELNDPEFSEFVELVTKSQALIRKTLQSHNDLSRAVDALREHCIMKAEYEVLKDSGASVTSDEQLNLQAEFERVTQELENEVRRLTEQNELLEQLESAGYVGEDE